MTQQAFIDFIRRAFTTEPRIEALFLGGSFGRGTADEFSDLDFVGLVASEEHPGVSRLWRNAIEAYSPIVFWNERAGGGTLLNAITADWLRVDLWMLDRTSFLKRARSNAGTYTQTTLLPVLDRANVLVQLPAARPEPETDHLQIEYAISEFIRVLGLVSVGLGRGEYVLGVTGVGLLRDLLTRIMIEETLSPDRGGMLHLSRTITQGQMDELLRLPYPGPNRTEILAAHSALATAFFPRARRLAARLDIEWPAAFEAATKQHLQRIFGTEMELW